MVDTIQLHGLPEQPDDFDPKTHSTIVSDRATTAGSGMRKVWETFEPGIEAESGTSITLDKDDHFGRITGATNAAAVTLTVAPDLPGGAATFYQGGAGLLTVAAGMGVTLRYPASAGLKANGQWAVITLVRIAANEWLVIGGVA